jgi:hypothetical protein
MWFFEGFPEARSLTERVVAGQGKCSRLTEAGLASLDLGILPKSDPRKVQIAKAVRTKICVPLSFVARELSMGTPMNVSERQSRMIKGKNILLSPNLLIQRYPRVICDRHLRDDLSRT